MEIREVVKEKYGQAPVAFAAGTLTLATPCSSWAAQLRAMREEIRAEVNSFLGAPIVKTLRIQVAPTSSPKSGETGRPKVAGSGRPELQAAIFDLPNELDPETARIFERSFAKYFARAGKRAN